MAVSELSRQGPISLLQNKGLQQTRAKGNGVRPAGWRYDCWDGREIERVSVEMAIGKVGREREAKPNTSVLSAQRQSGAVLVWKFTV